MVTAARLPARVQKSVCRQRLRGKLGFPLILPSVAIPPCLLCTAPTYDLGPPFFNKTAAVLGGAR
jgi:hypothetical protein